MTLGNLCIPTLSRRRIVRKIVALLPLLLLGALRPAAASTAYGTLNNFDCVNDTGVECHGFEIELDDCRSTDITYTYDYNHYGIPKITEDDTDPLHPRVFVRYASTRNPDGSWAAYTAIPAGPIAPTQGHQFTDPSVNFGGEHFGVGYYGAPTAVKYNWLLDDGAGNLVHGPPVYVSTPTFVYIPPAPAVPPQVIAVIQPPAPQEVPIREFGDATWVKEIKTTTHNPKKVRLEELVGDDPGKPQPWANGEPAEVEVEWQVMQTEFAAANGGKNGELDGAPEGLPGGDEVVTRRYEFYKYVGPVDAETGEAVAENVAADGIHGKGTVTYADHFDPIRDDWVTVTVDLSTVVVVGDFVGAQMSGFDAAPALGLIEHVQDGEANVAYPDRTVVVAGGAPFLAGVKSGSLPDGLTFDPVTGILSGTPTAVGTFNFTIEATDLSGATVSRDYTVKIEGIGPPPNTFNIITSAAPAEGGITWGDGIYNPADNVTVHAVANPGYNFVNWTEAGFEVSNTADYTFSAGADRSLVANFTPIAYTISASAAPAAGGSTSGGGSYDYNTSVTVRAVPNAGYRFDSWTEGGAVVSNTADYTFTVDGDHSLVANFVPVQATTLTISNVKGYVGKAVTLSATLKSATTKLALANEPIQFAVDGVNVGGPVTTSATGQAKLSYTIPNGTAIGAHTITATFAGDTQYQPSTRTGTLTVVASALSSVKVSPSSVTGGVGSTGTVTLTGYAPAGGLAVALVSNSVSASVPATVVVPAGQLSVTFPITTAPVAVNTAVTITATQGAVTRTTKLTVKAPVLSALSLSPTSVRGGLSNSTATVKLTGNAPVGGVAVAVSSSNTAAASVPATVVVPEGQSTVTFMVTTHTVTKQTSVSLSATVGTVVKKATLTVKP